MPIVAVTKRDLSGPAPVFRTTAGVTPQAFGADIGWGNIGSVLDTVSDIAVKVAEELAYEDSIRKAKQADADYNNDIFNILTGPEGEGYLSLQGENALDTSVVFEAMSSARKSYMESLGGDQRALDLFTVSSNQSFNTARNQIGTHTRQQRQKAELATIIARMSSAAQTAGADPLSDLTPPDANGRNIVDINLDKITGEAIAEANLLGIDVDTNVLARQSQFLTSTITAAISIDAGRAGDMIGTYIDNLTVADRSNLERLITGPKLIQESDAFIGDMVSRGLSREKMVEEARAIPPGEDSALKEQILQSLSKRFARDDFLERTQISKITADWGTKIRKGTSYDSLVVDKPEEFAILSKDINNIELLQSMELAYIKRVIYADISSPSLLHKLSRMGKNLLDVDLENFKHQLTEQDYKIYLNRQSGMLLKLEAKKENSAVFSTMESVVAKRLPDLKNDPETQNRVFEDMNGWITEQLEAGITPNRAEILDRLNDRLRLINRPGFFNSALDIFSDPTLLNFLRTADQDELNTFTIDIENIKPEWIPQITAVFEDRNKQITDDLLEQYAAAHAIDNTERKRSILASAKNKVIELQLGDIQ